MFPIVPRREPRRLPFLRAALVTGACLAAAGSSNATIVWSDLFEPGSGGRIASLAVDPNNSDHVLIGGDMLGVGASTNATASGVTWARGNGMSCWECGEFTFDPTKTDGSKILLGTMGGPYQSTDGGATWSSLRGGMPAAASDHFTAPIQKIVFLDNLTVLAFGGSHRRWNGGSASDTKWGAVWKATRASTTAAWGNWTQLTAVLGSGTGGNGGNILSIALASDGKLFAVVDGQGVFKSTNQGSSWTAFNSGLPSSGTGANGVICQGTSLYIAVTGSTSGVYSTTSTGSTWTVVGSSLPSSGGDYQWVAVSSGNSALYTSDNTGGTTKGVWKVTKSGSTWGTWSRVLQNSDTQSANFAFIGGGPSMDYLAVDPTNGNNVYAGNGCYVTRSTTAGAVSSWTDVTSDYQSGPPLTFSGTGYVGLCSRNVKFNPLLPSGTRQTVICAMDDGKYWSTATALSTTAPEDWTNGFAGTSPMPHFDGSRDVTFSGSDGKTLYLVSGQGGTNKDSFQGITRSTDGGVNWSNLYNGSSSGGTGLPGLNASDVAGWGVYADPNSPYDHVWAVIQDANAGTSSLYYSTDGGNTWNAQTLTGPSGSDTGLSCIASRSQPGSAATHPTYPFYVGGSQGVYKVSAGSGAGSVAFLSGTGTGPTNVTWMVTMPTNQQNVYAVSANTGSTGGVYKWTNSSSTWTHVYVPSSNETVGAVDVDPNNVNRIIVCDTANPSADVSPSGGVFLSTTGDAGPFTAQNTGVWMLRASAVRFDPFEGSPSLVVLGLNGGGFLLGQ